MTFQQELNKCLQAHGPLTAVEYPCGNISYAALAARAGTITRWLLAEDPGSVIGILLHDRVDLIASIIGIANARCIFVPLDPALPKKRLDVMLKDLRPTCILCSKRDEPAQECSSRIAYLEDIAEDSGKPRRRNSETAGRTATAFDPEDSLYIYFTSGSTGVPKGIVGKNGSLLQFLRWEMQ